MHKNYSARIMEINCDSICLFRTEGESYKERFVSQDSNIIPARLRYNCLFVPLVKYSLTFANSPLPTYYHSYWLTTNLSWSTIVEYIIYNSRWFNGVTFIFLVIHLCWSWFKIWILQFEKIIGKTILLLSLDRSNQRNIIVFRSWWFQD